MLIPRIYFFLFHLYADHAEIMHITVIFPSHEYTDIRRYIPSILNKRSSFVIMKYHSEMNRCRGVNPRLLGQMLGSDTPIDADYTPCDRRTNGNSRAMCGCGNSSSEGCGYANRAGCGTRTGEGCGNRERNESMTMRDASLASACAGDPSLAMVYSPHQVFDGLYSTDEALERGTLFTELDKPWKVGGCK